MSVSKVTKILVHNGAEVRDIMRRFRNLKRNDKCTDEIVFEGIGVDPGRIAVICGMLLGDIRKIDVKSVQTDKSNYTTIKTTVSCGIGELLVGGELEFEALSKEYPSMWKLHAPREGETISSSVYGFKKRLADLGSEQGDGIHICAAARAIGIFLVFAATVNDADEYDIMTLTAHNTKIDGNTKTVLHMLIQRSYIDAVVEESDE